jgi:hypothetical protein
LVLACDSAAGCASAAAARSGGGQKVRYYTIHGAGDCKAPRDALALASQGCWRARIGESAEDMLRSTFQKYRIETASFLFFQ